LPCEPEHVEQLAALLSAHAACVVPGAAVSPDDVRSRLDRDAGEFVIDPWVRGRETLVSIERDRVVAAGQRWRFGAEPHVSDAYRGAAELRWFCFWPRHREAGAAVLDKAIADSASATRLHLSGDLPGPLVYGIPDAWEHVQELARERGFANDGRAEVLLAARLDELPGREPAPEGCVARPGVAWSGDALLTVKRDGGAVARMEYAIDGARRAGSLWGPFSEDGEPEAAVARWLWLQSFDLLRLGGCDRVIAALWEDEPAVSDAIALGLRRVARLAKGWTLKSS
jgi:hypothetical protein